MNNEHVSFFEKTKSWIKKHPFITIIIVLIILGAIGSSGNKPVQTNTQPESKQVEQKQEAIKITASKLAQAYIDNEVNGDTLYKGKLLEVSGTIKDIGKDILDYPYVMIESNPSDYFTQVQLLFSKDDLEKLSTLKKGTPITIQGIGNGKLGNVLVRNSSIVE
jgi:hypothetical protein